MSKSVRWQIPFVSTIDKTHYRVDIYDEGTFTPVQLTAGPTPFVTSEDSSEDFFAPVRTQTGTLQICTKIPSGGTLSLNDILPANNIDRPVRLVSIAANNTETIEWQGFLSCEAYNQDYIGIPQILDIPVISVLEAMKSIELTDYYLDSSGGETISGLISAITRQIEDITETQVATVFSEASDDILTKYIFSSQYFKYEVDEATGNITYLYSATTLYEIVEEICKFMGWCLREVSDKFYFVRLGSDELGMTTVNMSALSWRGTGHQRTLLQGAKSVSVEASIEGFQTYFDMPQCPTTGLNQKNAYGGVTAMPLWYYDKCTQATVGMFSTTDTAKAFLARFYGIRENSYYPWNTIYADIGFNNCIYLIGQKYENTSYSKLCTVKSVMEFSVITGVFNTVEDVGYIVLKVKDEVAAYLSGAGQSISGYIRCGLKFLGYYYSGITGITWSNQATSFKLAMENGNGEIWVPIPRLSNVYTFAKSNIEFYLYDDFDNGKTSALISEISISYEPPFKKNKDEAKSNRYAQRLTGYRDEIKVDLKLASSFNNRNALSLIYGVKTYTAGSESMDYLEPITKIDYNLAGGTTEPRRPEVDLLNRLADYYGAARQRLELEVAHPTAAPLPLLKLNGINDGKVFLPLSESRDWKADTSKLTCFETAEQPSES